MYADDILLYCKGSIRNINLLKEVFLAYSMASGQLVNPSKSFVYAGAIPSTVFQRILDLNGFSQGFLPFTYLGIPLFKGKVKAAFLQPVADKIVSKLAAWKDQCSLWLVELPWLNRLFTVCFLTLCPYTPGLLHFSNIWKNVFAILSGLARSIKENLFKWLGKRSVKLILMVA
ncbi:uncharacterized protein LOC131643061 [Vicia villosa]|uniref:uncharacterized protein LOC131643061 n=1 Tax=Vicia villosa TaxID=3911 RepID=UPI00273C4E6A|nr:uncharacterized protein LOC131643061 [Vicia villosa]